MANFQHLIENIKWITVLKLKWEIDDNNIDMLKEVLDPMLYDETIKKIIVNLKDLTYINSVVIWWFAGKIVEFWTAKKLLVLSSPNKDLLLIIDMVWLTSIVDVYESDEECFLSFEK